MINTRRMKELLTINVDENAHHFVLFLNNGTLLGHDEDIAVRKSRSFAALAGLTWRRHASQIGMSQTFTVQQEVQHVNTLQLFHKAGKPKELETIIVEWEGIVASIVEVKDRVLLAAQRDLTDFKGNEESLGKHFMDLKITAEKKYRRTKEIAAKDDPNVAPHRARRTTAGSKIDQSEDGAGGKSAQDSTTTAAAGGASIDAPKLENKGVKEDKAESRNMVNALIVRATAMAKGVLEEWPGPVPEDFY